MTTEVGPPVGVVVLDLDDTLYLERDYVMSGFRAVDRWLQEECGCEGFLIRAVGHFTAGRRRDVFDAVLFELGVRPVPGLVERMVAVYREHDPEIRLLPDAERLLGRTVGYLPVALLTDGYLVAQRKKIAALGLAARLDFLVCTDEWGRAFWKPHRHCFELIQERFGQLPEAFCYVADNPTKDFVAPRALGWRTVHVARPEGVHATVVAADARAAAAVRVVSLDALGDAFWQGGGVS